MEFPISYIEWISFLKMYRLGLQRKGQPELWIPLKRLGVKRTWNSQIWLGLELVL